MRPSCQITPRPYLLVLRIERCCQIACSGAGGKLRDPERACQDIDCRAIAIALDGFVEIRHHLPINDEGVANLGSQGIWQLDMFEERAIRLLFHLVDVLLPVVEIAGDVHLFCQSLPEKRSLAGEHRL